MKCTIVFIALIITCASCYHKFCDHFIGYNSGENQYSSYDDSIISIRNGHILNNGCTIGIIFTGFGKQDTAHISMLSVILRLPNGDSIVSNKQTLGYYENPTDLVNKRLEFSDFAFLPDKFKYSTFNKKYVMYRFEFLSPLFIDDKDMFLVIRSMVNNIRYDYDMNVKVMKNCYFAWGPHEN